jgi:hypothetical protein
LSVSSLGVGDARRLRGWTDRCPKGVSEEPPSRGTMSGGFGEEQTTGDGLMTESVDDDDEDEGDDGGCVDVDGGDHETGGGDEYVADNWVTKRHKRPTSNAVPRSYFSLISLLQHLPRHAMSTPAHLLLYELSACSVHGFRVKVCRMYCSSTVPSHLKTMYLPLPSKMRAASQPTTPSPPYLTPQSQPQR